jgi:hypothetical protein
MCGIVGILGREPVAMSLVSALKRLEYRGYDSAGIATLEANGIERLRAPGKLSELEVKLNGRKLNGTAGIGHTRWATHGVPNEVNAHPHIAGKVAVVHNGIIENFRELKNELEQAGVMFATQTDTEVVAHLLNRALASGCTPNDAVWKTLNRLRGAFALAIMFTDEPDLMIGARQGPPLAVGHGDGQMFLGSDAIALAPFTNRVTYLEDGDWAVLSRRTLAIFDADGIDQDEVPQGVATAHRHLGGDPAPHPQAQDIDALQAEHGDEVQVQVGQIVDAVDGLGPLRSSEPRMRRRQHRESRCQGGVIRLPLVHHFAIVQHQQRPDIPKACPRSVDGIAAEADESGPRGNCGTCRQKRNDKNTNTVPDHKLTLRRGGAHSKNQVPLRTKHCPATPPANQG